MERNKSDFTFSGDEGEDQEEFKRTDSEIIRQLASSDNRSWNLDVEKIDTLDPLNFDREIDPRRLIPRKDHNGIEMIGAFNNSDGQHSHQTSWEDFEKPKSEEK